MKRICFALLFSLIITIVLGSCGETGIGPQTWIDTPQNNTTAPLAPLTIMAHASDTDGISAIEFIIDSKNIYSVQTGGKRMESSQVEWTPPGPGIYLIGARGINNSGIAGALATSRITISMNLTVTPTGGKTTTPTTNITTTATSTLTKTVTKTPTPFPADTTPSVVARSNANCREGPGTGYSVYGTLPKGQEAVITGRLSDNSWLLIGVAGWSMDCWVSSVTVDIKGDLKTVQVVSAPAAPAEQPELPPPSGPQPPPVVVQPPAPVDTTPPTIYNPGVQPDLVLTEGGGCPSYSRTVTVAAAVADEGGLGNVTANWAIAGGESGQAAMTMGGLGFWTTIGPFHTVGPMTIYIIAVDISGNSSQSGTIVVTVNECLE